MADARQEIGRLKVLARLQGLRREASATQLAQAQAASAAAQDRLGQAQGEEAATRYEVAQLLQSPSFLGGSYLGLLELLQAQSAQVAGLADKVASAQQHEETATLAYRHADARAEMLQGRLKQLHRKQSRREDDMQQRDHLDLHNLRTGAQIA